MCPETRFFFCGILIIFLLSGAPVSSGFTSDQNLLGFSFKNIAAVAGLKVRTVYGGQTSNKYLLETTGCGVALFDFDGDGWLDIFLVNGSRLEGFNGAAPHSHLYRNNHDGTFTDVTESTGTGLTGWGQSASAGDYDNDGDDDLFVTFWGNNVLLQNQGDGTFTNVAEKAGVAGKSRRWNSGCAFLDYDRDGDLDLFVANYIDFDPETTPTPDSGLCLYKGVRVACGPPGLPGGKNILYRNNGDDSFTDISDESGITEASGTYGLGVLTGDFDNDGWTDVYVANDSNPSALYQNNKNGTFTDIGILAGCAYSQDGKPQAGMGVSAGDYDRDGWLDIFKTNFAGDTANLYRNVGKGIFEESAFSAGVGVNTRWLGWGCAFVDLDNDGWLDIFQVNGHVYPEVNQLNTEAQYKQRKVVYQNERGRFIDITERLASPVTDPRAGRGCAFGDVDNDGDVDVVINNVNDTPDLFRLDSSGSNHWISIRLIGTTSNRSGIGARLKCTVGKMTLIDEVRSGGSYFSQNDLRVHFGLGKVEKIDSLEVSWLSGHTDRFENLPADKFITIKEGQELNIN